MKQEIIFWKEISSFPNYEISTGGRVRSLERTCNWKNTVRQIPQKILKAYVNTNGYMQVNLDGKNRLVSRLVAEAFVPNPDNLPQVNHKDKNRQNNHYLNLEWATNRGNSSHGYVNKNTVSKYVGVTWCKQTNKWKAQIKLNYKTKFLGRFIYELEAAKAYNMALEEYGLTNKYKNGV